MARGPNPDMLFQSQLSYNVSVRPKQYLWVVKCSPKPRNLQSLSA